jgi:hypothetical protein
MASSPEPPRTLRRIHYTFVLSLADEDEILEANIEEGIDNVLETVGFVDNPEGTEFDLELFKKVVVGDESDPDAA